jgi:glycosyltransferase involved in cell wall biosynthesis
MVRNEADVIAGTIRHMVSEVDHLIVSDNGSTDGTREILDQLARDLPLTVVDDPERAYRQSAKMSALAEQAATMGATWIVPFDADELWHARLGNIGMVLSTVDTEITVAAANLYNHFPSSIDPPDSDPFRSIVWRQPDHGALPKVAFRWQPGAVIHQGNHGVTLPHAGRSMRILDIRHFPYRTEGQFVAKAVQGAEAYKAAPELPADMGTHWRNYGEIYHRDGREALADVFREHFWFRSPGDSGLIYDPAPYQRWPR